MVLTYTSNKDLKTAAMRLGSYSNKRDRGYVVIIGGSNEYHGAPILAAKSVQNTLASLRIGAGYAILFVPKRIEDIARRLSPNTIIRGLESFEEVKKQIEKADAVAIGMGLGSNPVMLREAAKIVEYAAKSGKKVVVDADCIRAISQSKGKLGNNVVLTPHDGEFQALSGIRLPKEDLNVRVAAAKKVALNRNCIILLKGHSTIITDGRKVVINKTKSASLATMGTGDVLSGIIAGYAATGCSVFEAATAGAYLHGLIGDRLNKVKGNHILAVDVVDAIPGILKKFDKR
jgi:ADP-dependent NAD(P)H-hydrate dehydratase / NAD(P)H-hydrate epimerase